MQRRFLRGRAHHLKPCVHVGQAGVTAAVLAELVQALDHHELVKVSVRVGDRVARDAAVETLVHDCQALLVSRIGNVAVLYRPSTKRPQMILPATAGSHQPT